jgi:hypothetical protein
MLALGQVKGTIDEQDRCKSLSRYEADTGKDLIVIIKVIQSMI